MAGYISDDTRKVTTHRLIEMKERGEKISMLTAYDYTMAQIVDGAGMDVILVGDSASNVMAGNVAPGSGYRPGQCDSSATARRAGRDRHRYTRGCAQTRAHRAAAPRRRWCSGRASERHRWCTSPDR